MPIWPKGLPKNMNNCGLPVVVVVVPPLQILDSDKEDIFTEDLNNFTDDDKSNKRQNISPISAVIFTECVETSRRLFLILYKYIWALFS